MPKLSRRDATLAKISEHIPYRGRCAFCGGIDARHRLFEAISERHRAGDSIELLAWDFGVSEDLVGLITY